MGSHTPEPAVAIIRPSLSMKRPTADKFEVTQDPSPASHAGTTRPSPPFWSGS